MTFVHSPIKEPVHVSVLIAYSKSSSLSRHANVSSGTSGLNKGPKHLPAHAPTSFFEHASTEDSGETARMRSHA